MHAQGARNNLLDSDREALRNDEIKREIEKGQVENEGTRGKPTGRFTREMSV
jgi:hypothetical protein